MSHSRLDWEPDSALATGKGSALQEFVKRHPEGEARITLGTDGEAEVEAKGRIIARTEGFQNAAALAELYGRRDLLLLRARDPGVVYAVSREGESFRVRRATTPCALAQGDGEAVSIGLHSDLLDALDTAAADAKTQLTPLFIDQAALFHALGTENRANLVVAAALSRDRLDFAESISLPRVQFFHLSIAVASDGLIYSIYRLANGRYLCECRSLHAAVRIGEVDREDTAQIVCMLNHASGHSGDYAALQLEAAEAEETSPDVDYLARQDAHGCVHLATRDGQALGTFPSLATAEAYATVHRQAISGFGR